MVKINNNKKLSIICPTLNEAKRLPLLIADVNLWPYKIDLQIIDAGSNDLTTLIAELNGANIINIPEANRGEQLKQGAIQATGEWLLFLHADCRLPSIWPYKLEEIIDNPNSENNAWFFDFKVDSRMIEMRLLEFAVALRSFFLQRPYGDQGLLIKRNLYIAIGGYSNLHLMEDLDLVIRLSKVSRLKRIGLPIYISSRSWSNTNIFKKAFKNAAYRSRWLKGEDSKLLAKEYYHQQ